MENKAQENGLERDISKTLNLYCQESGSDTPDFILAQYLLRCLDNFNRTIARREDWYGRKLTKDKPSPFLQTPRISNDICKCGGEVGYYLDNQEICADCKSPTGKTQPLNQIFQGDAYNTIN